jgi:hypothetical protein
MLAVCFWRRAGKEVAGRGLECGRIAEEGFFVTLFVSFRVFFPL